MIPVHQTLFGPEVGNCLPACLASILEIPIDDIPNFCAGWKEGDGPEWFHAANRWAARHGYGLIQVGDNELVRRLAADSGCYSLACGKSPRGDFDHQVIYRGVEMVHDPHPSGAGIVGEPTEWMFFVAIEPGKRGRP